MRCARTVNVETESGQPDSLLNFYKNLLKLRHTEPALVSGDYVTLNPDDPYVFSFLRRAPEGTKGRAVLVALNMSGESRSIHFDLKKQLVEGTVGTVLESNFNAGEAPVPLGKVTLPPYGALVLAVE